MGFFGDLFGGGGGGGSTTQYSQQYTTVNVQTQVDSPVYAAIELKAPITNTFTRDALQPIGEAIGEALNKQGETFFRAAGYYQDAVSNMPAGNGSPVLVAAPEFPPWLPYAAGGLLAFLVIKGVAHG